MNRLILPSEIWIRLFRRNAFILTVRITCCRQSWKGNGFVQNRNISRYPTRSFYRKRFPLIRLTWAVYFLIFWTTLSKLVALPAILILKSGCLQTFPTDFWLCICTIPRTRCRLLHIRLRNQNRELMDMDFLLLKISAWNIMGLINGLTMEIFSILLFCCKWKNPSEYCAFCGSTRRDFSEGILYV